MNMQTLNPYLAPILEAINEFLNDCSVTNEHQIIKYLQEKNITPFDGFSLSQSTDLFSAHFLCMHALYHLKNQYKHAQLYALKLESVRVERVEFDNHTKFKRDLSHPMESIDPLEEYYLDASHYFETQEDDINNLLKSFWEKYLAQDHKNEALHILELPLNADSKMIKQQYHRLAQKYHPDKGGCAKKFDEIRQAKSILDKVS